MSKQPIKDRIVTMSKEPINVTSKEPINVTKKVSINYREFRQTKDDIDFLISNIKTPEALQSYTMKQVREDLDELQCRFRDWSVENGLATYDSEGIYHEGKVKQDDK